MKYWAIKTQQGRIGGLSLREVRDILKKNEDVKEAELYHVYYGDIAYVDEFTREEVLTKTKRELENGSTLNWAMTHGRLQEGKT